MSVLNAARLTGLAGLMIFVSCPLAAQTNGGTFYAPWMEGPAEQEQNKLQAKKQKPELPDHEADAEISPTRLSLNDITKFLDKADAPELTASMPSLSTIEALYAERIIDELEQFGYDIFDENADISMAMPAGKVAENYILSSGDRLTVTVRGQENVRQRVVIDSQGMLIAEPFAPVMAAGKTIASVRDEMIAQAKSSYNTDIYLSLDGVRQIGVMVMGDVKKPGLKTLTPFHTILDVLNASGGINKTGSLRMIKLVRGGKTRFIDLYAVMMQGEGGGDLQLNDGDRLIIPPLGPTVAVSGAVKRPAIYEIKRGQKLTLSELLGLAGGVLIPADNRFMRLAAATSGDEFVEPVAEPNKRLFGDGDILQIARSESRRASDITVEGETRQPGNHPLAKAKNLSDLIKDARILGDDIYPLIGVIERRDPAHLTKSYVEFSPQAVMHKQFDGKLEEGDRVHLFSVDDIVSLSAKSDSVAEASNLLTPVSFTPEKPAEPQNTRIDDPLLVSFLKERSVMVRGAVRRAGPYPVAEHTSLESVLAASGGLTVEAATGNIEITSRAENGVNALRRQVSLQADDPRQIIVGPGDTVRINQKYQRVADQSVTLLGEVAHPGKYDLMPGDTLLSLLERAGGLSAQAYPAGTIFSRKAERVREEAQYRAQAQDLEMKLATALGQQDDDKKPDMTQVSATQGLVAQLKAAQAVGRITVEADPGVLMNDPEQNILLESGDKIYIPKRPMNVHVAGEVLSPAALQFRKGKGADNYIQEAGGTTYYADSDRAFVIQPDGSARPLDVSSWNHSPTFIMPGSTIIVPRDPKPFNFLDGAERISQILANLAISGLYVDALGDDD